MKLYRKNGMLVGHTGKKITSDDVAQCLNGETPKQTLDRWIASKTPEQLRRLVRRRQRKLFPKP